MSVPLFKCKSVILLFSHFAETQVGVFLKSRICGDARVTDQGPESLDHCALSAVGIIQHCFC